MFPPVSPLTERIRAELEIEKLEREAIWRAQMQPARRLRLRLPNLFSFRRHKVEKRSTVSVRQVNAEC